MLLMIVCFVIGLTNVTKGDNLLSNIICNVVYIMPKIPAFLLGISLAGYVKQEKSFSLWWLILLFILALATLYATKHLVYTYVFFLFPLFYVLLLLIEKGIVILNKVLRFMGGISLESYLCNTMLPILLIPLCRSMGMLSTGLGQCLFYALLILIGTYLSTIIHKLCKKL